MNNLLIPRIDLRNAEARLLEIQKHLIAGGDAAELVELDPRDAVPNPTGGLRASASDIERWRTQIRAAVSPITSNDKIANDRHGLELGRALCKLVDPIPGDAGHDGVWSFLSLYVFPDIVNERWPLTTMKDSERKLSADRWIGAQMTGVRDRNYIKASWLRYSALGDVMESARVPLGEDEFVNLLERTAVARNTRLVNAAARSVVQYDGSMGRAEYCRGLMKLISYHTGARSLDLLTDAELVSLIKASAAHLERPETPTNAAPPQSDGSAMAHSDLPKSSGAAASTRGKSLLRGIFNASRRS